MRRIRGKKTYAGILLLAWLCLLVWGNGTMEARFTDFDEVVCRFTIDAEPPELEVKEPAGISEESAVVVSRADCTVSGTVTDPGGIASVTVNGQEVSVNKNGQWTTAIALTPDSLTKIVVTATDMTGNRTVETRYVIHRSEAYALYSAADQSLTFVRAADPIRAGITMDGKYINAVYTGFETARYTSYSRVPWSGYRQSILHVIVKDPICPLYTAYWFYGFQKCQDMEIQRLDTSKVTDMQSMFSGCKSLTSLDLSCMDTTAPGNKVSNMFFNNNLLAEITVGETFTVRYPFPTPSPQYIEGADGKWYHKETGIGYLPKEIPQHVKATYVAVKPSGPFPPYLSVRTPEGISAEDPMYVAQSRCWVEGIALDDNGIASVTVNGAAVNVEETGAWRVELALPFGQVVPVVVTATDQDGLSATETRFVCSLPLTVHFDANGGHFDTETVNTVTYFEVGNDLSDTLEGTYGEPIHHISDMIFDGWYTTVEGREGTEFSLSMGGREITVYARWNDVVPPQLEVVEPASQDSKFPTLTGQAGYLVRGNARDGVGLASVTVNGKEVEWLKEDSWWLELNLERDVVTSLRVVAVDHYGNVTTKVCYVSFDESGPVLTMTAPTGLTEEEPTYCGSSQYTAMGTAKDSAGIRSLTVNGEQGNLNEQGIWNHVLSLEADQVTWVNVWAEDTLGKLSSLSRYVYYDSQPPSLELIGLPEDPQNGSVQVPSSEYILAGTVSDRGSGVDWVRVNDDLVQVDAQGNWQYTVDLRGGVMEEIVVTAADQVGNVSQEIRYVRYDGFSVTYDANGGTFADGNTLRSLTYYRYGESAVLADPERYEEPIWEPSGNGDWGYRFGGWYTSPDGDPGSAFDSEEAQPGMTVYAKWEPLPRIRITYDANGGFFGTEESNQVSYVWVQEHMQVAEGEYQVPIPSAPCWQFEGWYTSPEGEVGTEFVLGKESQSGTVYAKWKDVAAPEIQILTPQGTSLASPQMTGRSFWLVEGVVTDQGSGIREIAVQGDPVSVDEQGRWSVQVALTADNVTAIIVEAVDREGNRSVETEYVYWDHTDPTLTVITPQGRTRENPTYSVSSTYLVTGNVSDNDKILQVTVNGISAQRQDSGSWWCAITLEDGVTQTVEVAAVDQAGNVIIEYRYVCYDSTKRFEEFTVTVGNRHKIGYITGMTELEIPETFYDAETDTWYHVVAIGFESGESASVDRAAFAREISLTRVLIPGSVRQIQRYSFYDAVGLQALAMGYGIREIDLAVFHGCNGLAHVSLPDSITELGSGAFMMSESLTTINLPKGLTVLYPDVFSCCYRLTGQIVIPEGVQEIGSNAFLDTEITNLVIPTSVKSIREHAFRYCDRLTDIYYEGKQEQWAKIAIGSNNEALFSAQIHCQYVQSSQKE